MHSLAQPPTPSIPDPSRSIRLGRGVPRGPRARCSSAERPCGPASSLRLQHSWCKHLAVCTTAGCWALTKPGSERALGTPASCPRPWERTQAGRSEARGLAGFHRGFCAASAALGQKQSAQPLGGAGLPGGRRRPHTDEPPVDGAIDRLHGPGVGTGNAGGSDPPGEEMGEGGPERPAQMLRVRPPQAQPRGPPRPGGTSLSSAKDKQKQHTGRWG